MNGDLSELKLAVQAFAQEREWDQFHSPKNLATALVVEAAELAEPFQWMSESDSARPDDVKKAAIADEIGDVLIYLVRLADKLEIDPLQAAWEKLEKNAEKYPVEKSKGSSRKYTEL